MIVNRLITIVTIYLAVVAAMYFFQRSFLYFPSQSSYSPADAGLAGIADVSITTDDGETLQAWYLPASADRPTILHFHGNAGSISDRRARMVFYQQQGLGALFVSYRGYGASSGAPSQTGLINDALASHNWLLNNGVAADNIVLVGESLGAAVAVQLAARRDVAAVVLEAPFTSTVDVARSSYWWLPVSLLMKDRFESIKIINKVTAPLLIIHGELDEITNVSLGKRLFEAANEPKEILIIAGASHNSIFNQSVWLQEQSFIDKYWTGSGN